MRVAFVHKGGSVTSSDDVDELFRFTVRAQRADILHDVIMQFEGCWFDNAAELRRYNGATDHC